MLTYLPVSESFDGLLVNLREIPASQGRMNISHTLVELPMMLMLMLLKLSHVRMTLLVHPFKPAVGRGIVLWVEGLISRVEV